MKKDEEIKEVLPSILGIIKRGLEHPETEVSSWENLEIFYSWGISNCYVWSPFDQVLEGNT
jgi:hypothetical protein